MSFFFLLNGTQQPQPGPAELDLLYKPVVDEIARRLRNRTFAQGGQLREFSDKTDPTRDQVIALIDDAAVDVAATAGINLPTAVWPIARRVVAVGTLLMIEPGSRDFNEARLRRFEREYESKLANLVTAAQDAQDGGDPGDVDDRDQAAPLGSFPAAPCDDLFVTRAEQPYC